MGRKLVDHTGKQYIKRVSTSFATVTLPLRRACGVFAVAVSPKIPKTVRSPHGRRTVEYANRTATSRFIARRKGIFRNRNAVDRNPAASKIARSPYGGREVALRWP